MTAANLSRRSTTTSSTTTSSPTTSTTIVPPATTTNVVLETTKSFVRDDRATCVSPPVIRNGQWVCNSNFHSNGVVCTNQCSNGFNFDRKDFFRQEITCKCIIDNDGNNQCRWTQRSRVIKEAGEILTEFWRNAVLPECLPNTDFQKGMYHKFRSDVSSFER